MSFNRTNLKLLRPELEQLLKSDDFKTLCAKYGMTASLGNAKFSETECTFQLKLKAEGAAKTDFESYAVLFGLKPTDLGKVIVVGGYSYTITGINPKAPKFPINTTRRKEI